MKVGFVGLGRMGNPMARRLIGAGHDLVVSDTSADALQDLAAAGATPAASLAELGAKVDIVVLSLPTPAIVEAVALGSGGLAEAGVRIIVDLSTTGPTVTQSLATRLGEKGVTLIDAPVSGGISGAEAGSLTLMTSGPRKTYDEITPLLEPIGSKVFYLGEAAGAGQLMKVINNTLCAASVIATFEGLVVGAKAGLDTDTMLDVLNASSGQSFATSVKIPQCIADRSFPMRFTTELLDKDVRLCLGEAERLGVPMPVNRLVQQMLAMGMGAGHAQQDYANVIKLYEGWAGAEVGCRNGEET